MTQYQPPFQPDYRAYVPAPSLRPASVTALSIISIVLGSLGLFCGTSGLVMQILMLASGGKNPFTPNAPAMTNQAIVVYGAIDSVLTLVLSGMLLGGGIGGLKLKAVARRMMIGLSVAMIVWATLQLVLKIAWVIPATADSLKRMQVQMDPNSAKVVGSMMGTMQVVAACIAWIFWLILPTCFLILWRSPRVVSAFESGGVVPGPTLPPPFPGPPQPPTGGYGS